MTPVLPQEEMRLNRSMTPSRSSGSITPSRRPHRLPDNINKELERKIGNGAALKAKNGKSSAESEGSPDEGGININNRKKPGTLNDNFTRQRWGLRTGQPLDWWIFISNFSSLSNSRSTEAQDQKKGLIRKERAKKLRGNPSVPHSKEATSEHKYHFCQYCI